MSTGLINKASGLNDVSLGNLAAPLRQYMYSQNSLAKEKSLLTTIFPVVKSKQFAAAYGGSTGLGDGFIPSDEHGTTPIEATQDNYTKTLYNTTEWRKGLLVTRQMYKDDQISTVKDKLAMLVDEWWDTKERFGASILSNGFSTTHTFSGRSFDNSCADTKALFAIDHPYSNKISTTQSNSYEAAFTDVNLTKAERILSGMRGPDGKLKKIRANTIIIPFAVDNAAALQRQAIFEALNADGNPDSANKAGVYNAGRYNIVEWNYLENPSGIDSNTSWWMLADMDYIMKYKSYLIQDREEPEFDSWYDKKSKALNCDGYGRYTGGCVDYRGIAAFAQGLSGSTI